MIPAIPHTSCAPPSILARCARDAVVPLPTSLRVRGQPPPRAPALREVVQVLLPLPVGHGRQEPLPLVALVMAPDVVELTGQRAAHDLVLLERLERLPEVLGHAVELLALGEQVVDVRLLRLAGVELAADAVQAG